MNQEAGELGRSRLSGEESCDLQQFIIISLIAYELPKTV
jgi:hypothetical protein